MIQVGEVIGGDFRIDAKVRQGGMGTVFRAHQISLDRTVAVKVLRVQSVLDPEEALAHFRDEANVLSGLEHPQIPTIHTMGVHGEPATPYIVMEWLDGRTLHDRLEQEGNFAESAALETIRLLCQPLAAAHSKGVLHRDLKPANVYELKNGDIKLIDFGIAKSFGPAAYRAKRKPTDEGILKGTSWFMSPELARGEPATVRSDVYALGALLYNLLTGVRPFGDLFPLDQEVPVLMALIEGKSPTDVRKLVPARDVVAELIAKLMAKDPDARFESVDVVERAVRAIYADRQQYVPATPTARTLPQYPSPPRTSPTRLKPSSAPTTAARVRGSRALIIAWAALALAGAGLVGALIANSRRAAPSPASSNTASAAAPVGKSEPPPSTTDQIAPPPTAKTAVPARESDVKAAPAKQRPATKTKPKKAEPAKPEPERMGNKLYQPAYGDE